MRNENLKTLNVNRRGSAFRTFVILGTLVPAWHSTGVGLCSIQDSRGPVQSARFEKSSMLPYPSVPMEFQATAYCEAGITKSGTPVERGIVAADPAVIPLGSWIHVDGPNYSGLYQVTDTGRLIRGKIIDIYLPDMQDAIEFGRQRVWITVVKYGPTRTRPTSGAGPRYIVGFPRDEALSRLSN